MAQSHEQGTGKHAHKSSEEPYPHHEAPTQSGSSSGDSKESSSHTRQGPKSSGSGSGQSSSQGSDDQKSREYRDKDGNIHHHTTTYEEQHKGGRKAS